MARKLPSDPVKLRLQLFKRLYQHLDHFYALAEAGELSLPLIVTLPGGEEVLLDDLMSGINTLPPRQRQAFELICLQSYTESAATAIMLPESRWSTPIQQYADAALARMVEAYDQVQQGNRDFAKKKIASRRRSSKGNGNDSAGCPPASSESGSDAGDQSAGVPSSGPASDHQAS